MIIDFEYSGRPDFELNIDFAAARADASLDHLIWLRDNFLS